MATFSSLIVAAALKNPTMTYKQIAELTGAKPNLAAQVLYQMRLRGYEVGYMRKSRHVIVKEPPPIDTAAAPEPLPARKHVQTVFGSSCPRSHGYLRLL